MGREYQTQFYDEKAQRCEGQTIVVMDATLDENKYDGVEGIKRRRR